MTFSGRVAAGNATVLALAGAAFGLAAAALALAFAVGMIMEDLNLSPQDLVGKGEVEVGFP